MCPAPARLAPHLEAIARRLAAAGQLTAPMLASRARLSRRAAQYWLRKWIDNGLADGTRLVKLGWSKRAPGRTREPMVYGLASTPDVQGITTAGR